MAIALTDSKRGQVVASVAAALRAMTIAGGYHWDVDRESVQTDSINVLGVAHEKRPYFLVQASPDGTREFEPADQLTERFRLLVTAIVDAEGSAPDRKHAAAEALAMDVEKAVTVDLTRGGVCSDTRVLVPELIVGLGTGPTVALIQELECRIHRTHGVP